MENLHRLKSRRYIGSKYKISDWILTQINKYCVGDSFFDIFAGTGVVAEKAANRFRKIILNDILYSNYAIYNAFFGEGVISKKVDEAISKYNSLDTKLINGNYFSKNFKGKYFSADNSKLIGYIREDIENTKKVYKKRGYYTLLTSLIYAADSVSNTVGHYDAYIKGSMVSKKLIMKNIEPVKVNKVEIFREDANKLATKVQSDVVYIDPPYNSRQYERFYHILENIVKWDKPKLYGVALKPEAENPSDYCKVKAPTVFTDLIEKLNCSYIAVSYNNTYNSKSSSSRNKITLDEIEEILSKKGDTKIFKTKHKFFNSGKTDFDNHMEYLFITKVKL